MNVLIICVHIFKKKKMLSPYYIPLLFHYHLACHTWIAKLYSSGGRPLGAESGHHAAAQRHSIYPSYRDADSGQQGELPDLPSADHG